MENRRQLIIILLLVIAVVGIIVDGIGLGLVWITNKPLTDFGVRLLQAAQSTAALVERGIQPLDAALNEIQQPVEALSSAAAELSRSTAEPGVVLRLLPERLSDQLTAALDQVQAFFTGVEETIVNLNQTLEALNALPLVSVPTLADTDLPERYANLQSQVQTLRATAAEARAGVAGRLDLLAEQANSTAETITGWRQTLDATETQLTGLQQELEDLAEKLPLWIDLAAIAATLLLLAGIVSQLTVLVLARSLYKNTRLQLQPGMMLGEAPAD